MKRPSTGTGSGRLRGSRPSSFRPKLNSKYVGIQVRSSGELPHPDAEIAAQLVDLVAPDAIDRRRELLRVLGGDRDRATPSSVVDGVRHAIGRDRQRAARSISAQRTRPGPCGTGCRASADPCAPAAPARPTARGDESSPAGTDTGRRQKRCSADSEYGALAEPMRRDAPVRSPALTLIRPSLGDHARRPRAQRLITDRRSASFSPSR